MAKKSLIEELVELGELVLPVVAGPGGAAAVGIANKVRDMLGRADAGDGAAGRMRDELEAAVNRHADSTIAGLRGED